MTDDLMNEILLSADSGAFFRQLLESAPDAMIIIDEHGKIALVNGQAEAMFGYRRDELLDQPIEILLPERLHKIHVAFRSNYVTAPRLRPMGAGRDLLARRKDGSEFPVEISLSPVRSTAGHFVSSVIRDVTARKRMDDDIIAARDRLQSEGARVLGTGEPKIGAHGKPVLFLHPKDFNGCLVELEQV